MERSWDEIPVIWFRRKRYVSISGIWTYAEFRTDCRGVTMRVVTEGSGLMLFHPGGDQTAEAYSHNLPAEETPLYII